MADKDESAWDVAAKPSSVGGIFFHDADGNPRDEPPPEILAEIRRRGLDLARAPEADKEGPPPHKAYRVVPGPGHTLVES